MTRRRASRKNSLLRQREASSDKGHSRKSARALLRPRAVKMAVARRCTGR